MNMLGWRFSFLLLLGFVATLRLPAACVTTPSGSVAWWRGDSAADSAGVVVGTFRGAGKAGDGYVGTGFVFGGGTDALALPTTFKLSSQEFTVESWIKRSESNRASLDFEAGQFFGGSANGFTFGLTHQGQLYLSHVGVVTFYSTTTLTDTNWHHVAVTREGGNLRFYVDGVLASTVACSVVFDLNGPFAIGGLGVPYVGVSYGFLGRIDELAVYGRPLTPAEIAAIHQAGSAGKCSEPGPVFSCAPSPAGLVGWWQAEGDRKDQLANGTGTTGGTFAPGVVGQAFSFAGTAPGIIVGDPAAFRTQDFTIEAWVKRASTSLTTELGFGGVMFAGGSGSYGLALLDDGTLSVSQVGVDKVGSTGRITDTQWHHVAVTKAGPDVRFYIDGAAAGSAGYDRTFTFGTPFAIGSLGVTIGQNYTFLGSIDELGLYNRPLSAAEIASIHQAGAAGKCLVPAAPQCATAPAGLVAWYPGEGTAADGLGSHPGTFPGARFAAGKVGQAFDFDGSNEVVIPDAPEFNTGTFTIEAWIYPTVLDGTVDIIVNKETRYPSVLTDIQFEIGVKGPLNDAPNNIPTGNLAFFLGGVDGLPNNYGGWTDAKSSIPVATWTHVALVVEPGSATAYVNGVATFSVNGLGGKLSTNAWPMKLGSRSTLYVTETRPQDRFKGRIDEFSFYGRALTAGEIGSVFQAGSAGKCIPAYPPSIQAGPSDQTVSVGTDGRFSVVATGTGPLRYQWRFQDIDIAGATNAQLLLPKVGKSAAGKYSVAVCNAAGCAPVVSANLFVDAPVAVVRIGDATAKAPEAFSIPLLLVGNGDENAVGLSIRFDPRSLTFIGAEGGAGAGGSSTRLNSSQATNGAVGILIGLQSGARFPRGTNELVRLRFQPKVSAVEVVTPVQISDSPVKLQLADVDANALPVVWTDGNVRILATDFEGDVGPAPAGDRRVTAADWVLIGRYVAGLEVPADNSLFQRADCAPLSTGGNGRLTVGDWVQAGRFAVGLDPLMPANGPAAPVVRTLATPGGGRALPQSAGSRVVSISGGEFLAGQVKEVSVRLAASGDENALAFSVRHDPTRLRFVGADLGADATGATLYINSLQGSDGRIGLVLALPASAKFVAGDIEVAKFRFAGLPGGTGPMDLAFSDAPVFREVASATAETLPSLWADTVFTVASRNLSFRVVLTADGPVIEVSWPTGTTDVSLESATDPVGGKWSPVVAVPVNDGASRIVTLPLSATSSYYRLVVP